MSLMGAHPVKHRVGDLAEHNLPGEHRNSGKHGPLERHNPLRDNPLRDDHLSHNHLWMMLASCVLMVAVALVLFRYASSPWLWLMLLLCPLLHLWMMKDMFTKKEDCR